MIGRLLILAARIPRFTCFYLLELTKSNWHIACDVLRPHYRINPGIIELPLETKTDFQTMVLANLITMTPGTITVDVSEDRKTISVHFMYKEQLEAQRDTFNQNFYSVFAE